MKHILRHARLNRAALGKSKHRRRYDMEIGHTNYVEEDNLGYIHLVDTIRAGKGWSVIEIEIENTDFDALIDHMMQAHPEATIRAIGAALVNFRQTDC